MLVLSHSDTHNLNEYIGWCGCHEFSIPFLLSNLLSWVTMNSVCSSPISAQPLSVVVDCWFKIEEFHNQMTISSARNKRDKSFFLRKLTGFVPQLWIFNHILSCFVYSSLHLCLSSSVAQFRSSIWFYCALWSAFGLPRMSSFTLSIPVLSKTQLQKAFSLHAGALSLWHSPLNRHMAQCGCHERRDQSRSSQGYMAWCGCHEVFALISESLEATAIFYRDDNRNAQRWQCNTN